MNWSNSKHVNQWISTLIDYVFPVIGSTPIDRVSTPDVLRVLAPIWTAKPETARRLRQRLAIVLEWARAAGHRVGDNPVDLIGDALPRHKKGEEHHPALPYVEVAAFIARLRACNAELVSKLAFEFLILTATRSNDVRHASWDEVSFESCSWTIPGNDTRAGRRMKSGREHIVPLAGRCVEILNEARRFGSDSGLIFPIVTAAPCRKTAFS